MCRVTTFFFLFTNIHAYNLGKNSFRNCHAACTKFHARVVICFILDKHGKKKCYSTQRVNSGTENRALLHDKGCCSHHVD